MTSGPEPIISVLCTTYNQQAYIRDAIEGFLKQDCSRSLEILIHDDASRDGTAAIVADYARRYPGLIKPILQKENQFSRGNKPWPAYLFPSARGRFIALCEGDDYWTDPRKLQKQADYLSAHPECSVCFHPVLVKVECGPGEPHVIPRHAPGTNYDFLSLLKENFIPTCSVMYRLDPGFAFPPWFNQLKFGDWALHLLMASRGGIGFLQDIMAVYRIHEGSYWSTRPRSEAISAIIEMYRLLDAHFKGRFHRPIRESIASFRYVLGDLYVRQHRWREGRECAARSLLACRSTERITWTNRLKLLAKAIIHRP